MVFGRRVSLGRRGERLAARWLKRRGYRILERNYGVGSDEADIVAEAPDRRTVVIVEVKSRRSDDPPPEWSVGPGKQRFLARLASQMHREARFDDRPFRFDVIAIVWPIGEKPTIRHHEGAFESQGP